MLGDERVTSTAPMDRTSGGEPDCAWCNQLEKARSGCNVQLRRGRTYLNLFYDHISNVKCCFSLSSMHLFV